jgi:SAM-dependent methyltransferase
VCEGATAGCACVYNIRIPAVISAPESRHWDEHWQSLGRNRSLFGLLALATRRLIFQPAVAFYSERYFVQGGLFFEMGCGTAESSALVHRDGRKLIGLDFSAVALKEAQKIGCMEDLVQADVFSLPCRSEALDGIWNLGVMEHFTKPQLRACLKEFRRVLKPGGVVLLFWPSERNASRWVLGPIERVVSALRGRKFAFFPDEISRLNSKDEAITYLSNEGFETVTVDFSWRTAFIHMVVVGRKRV